MRADSFQALRWDVSSSSNFLSGVVEALPKLPAELLPNLLGGNAPVSSSDSSAAAAASGGPLQLALASDHV